MGISAVKKPELASGVADVRHLPLGRLAQGIEGTDGLDRVLSGSGAARAASAGFNSSI
jgi:hypothetical protein